MNKNLKKTSAAVFLALVLFAGNFNLARAAGNCDESFTCALNPFNVANCIAQKLGEGAGYILSSGIIALGFVLKGFAAIFFAISAYMFGIIFQLNMKMMDPSSITYSFISTGWTIVRDVANLGFVLFIILIALATIVRYRDYEAKKVLPRLIAAAILVNFSLAIPTVFINFSNIVTNYFLNGFKVATVCKVLGIGDPLLTQTCSLTNYMGGVMAPQKVDLSPKLDTTTVKGIIGQLSGANALESFMGGFMEGLSFTFTLYLGLLVYIMGTFVMICYGILFLIRLVTLHFLLVLAPITWLFWVIPQTQGMFSNWWKKFIQYVFFAPVALFFLYLVIKIGNEGNIFQITPNDSQVSAYVNFISFPAEMLQNVIRMFVIAFVMMGFLIGGLFASQKLSISGASGMMSLVKNSGKKAKAWAQKGATASGKAALSSRSGLKFANQLTKNKLTAPLGNYLAKTGAKHLEKTEKERESTVKALVKAGIKPADISEGLFKPESLAALNRIIANTGKPLHEELEKKDKAYNEALAEQAIYEKDGGKEKTLKEEYGKDAEKLAKWREERKAEKDPATRKGLNEKELETLEANIEKQKEVVETSKSAYEKSRNLSHNTEEARKAYEKAEADFEEFEEHFLKGFTDAQKDMWKNAKFDLSKTPFAGGARIRDQQVPDVSLGGVEKEIKRLVGIMENTQKQLSNPNLSGNERAQKKQLYDKASTDHEKLSTARNKLEEGRTKHRAATSRLEELKTTHKGYDNIPETDRTKVWKEIKDAETQVKEAKRSISLLRTPAFIKKVKGEKEKSEKEPKPKKPTASAKSDEEEDEEDEDE